MNFLLNIRQISKKYYVTICLAISLFSLFIIFGAVPEALYYNKDAILNGEYWRLLSAHFVHSDEQHLILNLLAFIILSMLIEDKNRFMLFLSLVSGIISINYYLWFNSIGVFNYAGLSGVLNTLLVLVLFQQMQQNKNSYWLIRVIPVAIYFASLMKIIIEIHSQQAIFSHISWQALPQVHWIGFVSGTLIALLLLANRNITKYIFSNSSNIKSTNIIKKGILFINKRHEIVV
jgi:rhomboid family GlyGly-CTERM serine protease